MVGFAVIFPPRCVAFFFVFIVGVFTVVTLITVAMIAAVAMAVTITIPVARVSQRRCGAQGKSRKQERQRAQTFRFHNPSSVRQSNAISA
ncbi:TRAP transporter large permease subunit [Cronobacter turicensis]|nr:TRAP transporter large permease subunit [Cronobacter turicensis]ELU8454221.1 TRAP transporter large permease subunit [Cronobacter turicensis]ELY4111568.1 TRAP transporter large permease subunit [Cronobacter turicensis]ELY4215167.1 TRAP transporter large permease subunit [Cronobacter turicensis]EMA1790327.1 TRAP transporter large permease subunit [Cronobacter turicensis]